MAPEIYWMVLVVVYSSLLVFPYAIVRIRRIGLLQVFVNPVLGDDPFEQAWAHRAYRAHMNAFENLALFAPIALAVAVLDVGNATTAISAQVYFWARVVHGPSTILKTPFVRTIVYFIGLGATWTMAWQILVQLH